MTPEVDWDQALQDLLRDEAEGGPARGIEYGRPAPSWDALRDLRERKRAEAELSNWDLTELSGMEAAAKELDAKYGREDDHPWAVRYYDRKGRRITMGLQAVLHQQRQYVIVKKTIFTMRGRYFEVSTVWLGLDHSFSLGADRVPLIFETMVFGGLNLEDPLATWRYSTERQARHGHKVALLDSIRALRETLPRKRQLIHKGRKP